jgi:hypothetical protein
VPLLFSDLRAQIFPVTAAEQMRIPSSRRPHRGAKDAVITQSDRTPVPPERFRRMVARTTSDDMLTFLLKHVPPHTVEVT